MRPYEHVIRADGGQGSKPMTIGQRPTIETSDTARRDTGGARTPTQKDPNPEAFPQTREGMLRRIERLQIEIKTDDSGETPLNSNNPCSRAAVESDSYSKRVPCQRATLLKAFLLVHKQGGLKNLTYR